MQERKLKTYAERLEAYLLDKEQRLLKKEEKERKKEKDAAREAKEREEKLRKKKDEIVKQQEKEVNVRKNELKKLNQEAATTRKKICTLKHQEDRLQTNIKKINKYFSLTMEVCDLMDWRLQLLQKIQEDPYNPHVHNFQNIICDIDNELSKKRSRLKYWQKKYF